MRHTNETPATENQYTQFSTTSFFDPEHSRLITYEDLITADQPACTAEQSTCSPELSLSDTRVRAALGGANVDHYINALDDWTERSEKRIEQQRKMAGGFPSDELSLEEDYMTTSVHFRNYVANIENTVRSAEIMRFTGRKAISAHQTQQLLDQNKRVTSRYEYPKRTLFGPSFSKKLSANINESPLTPEEPSLGDMLAKARLAVRKEVMMRSSRVLINKTLSQEDTRLTNSSYKIFTKELADIRDHHHDPTFADRIFSHDLRFFIHTFSKLRKDQKQSFSTDTSYMSAFDLYNHVSRIRLQRTLAHQSILAFDESEVIQVHVPPYENKEIYQETKLFDSLKDAFTTAQPRERVQIIPPKDSHDQRKQRALEERESTEAEIAAHDAPILAELASIAEDYGAIINTFTGQSNRHLRDLGITGKSGLDYYLKQTRISLPNETSSGELTKVLGGLHDLTTEHPEEFKEEFTSRLSRLSELENRYYSYATEHTLKGTQRAKELPSPITGKLDALALHWPSFQQSIQKSAYAKHYTEPIKSKIELLLEISGDDIETPTVTPKLENLASSSETTDSSVDQARRTSEKLDWVIFEEEAIHSERLIALAHESVRSKKHNKIVEEYRVESLLQLRELVGGNLYRSSEKVLNDSDNLYFVLRFTNPDDANIYAVAENPVYGNATYVLREDLLPLTPDETALSAIKLSRIDVRELGAKRIIHTTEGQAGTASGHLDKVLETIKKLQNSDY